MLFRPLEAQGRQGREFNLVHVGTALIYRAPCAIIRCIFLTNRRKKLTLRLTDRHRTESRILHFKMNVGSAKAN